MSKKLVVGGLSWGTDDEGMREVFSQFGEVLEAKVIRDRDTGRSRGFGFVTYDNEEDANAAIAALDGSLSFTFDAYPWGCDYYLDTGRMMPEDGLETLRGYDAILLGAVGSPAVPDHVSLHGLLLAIRQGFDQYINLRPVRLLRGAPCPLSGVSQEQIDEWLAAMSLN